MATLEFSVADASGLALLVNRWKTRENNASRAKHGRKTSQHEDENEGFGSVVPAQTKRYLHEFPTDLDETNKLQELYLYSGSLPATQIQQ